MEPKNTACLGALLIAFSLLNSTEAGAADITRHTNVQDKDGVRSASSQTDDNEKSLNLDNYTQSKAWRTSNSEDISSISKMEANGNNLTIRDSTIYGLRQAHAIGADVIYNPYPATEAQRQNHYYTKGEVSNNHLYIYDSTITSLYGNVAEGYAATASNNTGYLSNVTGKKDKYGYNSELFSLAKAATEPTSEEGIKGANCEVNNNTLEIVGGSFVQREILCAYAEYTAGTIYEKGKYPGQYTRKVADGVIEAKAHDNTLTLTEATIDGKYTYTKGVEVDGVVAAGKACVKLPSSIAGKAKDSTVLAGSKAIASKNKLIVNGGTYNGRLIGGLAISEFKTGTGEASNNTVELHNGTTTKKAPDFKGTAVLYGGYAASIVDENGYTGYAVDDTNWTETGSTSTGNTLQFNDVKDMSAGNIKNFQKLEYKYSELHDGDVILTLNDTAGTSIAKAVVDVTAGDIFGKNNGEFQEGNEVTLLVNENGLTADGATLNEPVITAQTGISMTYALEIKTVKDANGKDVKLVLTRTGTKKTDGNNNGNNNNGNGNGNDDGVLPGTKAIAEGAASGLALANESVNATIGLLQDFSLIAGSITPFVHVQGSSVTHETGSNVNLNTVSLTAGLGTGIETGAGKLSAGVFFEYGKGSYTTHNEFTDRSDVDGDGNSWYMGAGILAKMEFLETGPGHFYVEGSGHMGTVHNEFSSNDLRNRAGRIAKFDMDSPYYSLHGGLGYVWNFAEDHDLDVYGQYIWTRVQNTDDTLTTGDKFEYDDMDSSRVCFGARYTYKGNERFKPYAGVAYEHEFAGSCESTVYGHNVAAPSFEGDTGMGELGITMTPSKDLPLSIGLGVQGYVGQKRGVSGNCMVKYEF